MTRWLRRMVFCFLLLPLLGLTGFFANAHAASAAATTDRATKSCVWKVTASDGHTLYLAGSVHALRPSDYPLPKAYDAALQNSTRLAFEVAPEDMQRMRERLASAALLPRGVQLRDRVDPRTYAYLLRVLAKTHTPESQIASYQSWYLAMQLQSPGASSLNASTSRGVERYLQQKAAAAKKPISGLESWRAHADVFAAMNAEEAEATLLIGFIRLDNANANFLRALAAWRRGDAATVERLLREEYRDYPALYRRLIDARNQAWLPKIEGWLRGGGRDNTWLVVAGTGHMAGRDGLPELLRARGYQVEQL